MYLFYVIIRCLIILRIVNFDYPERKRLNVKMNLDELMELKRKKDAVIFAHYYVDKEVQAIADYVGDSFFLAKKGTMVNEKNIIMAGVYFMGETMKILNPDKHVFLLEIEADCPMAHMVTVEEIENMRKLYDDLSVVCYVNSTAEIKAHSDYCCTSANVKKVISAIKEKNIFFVPDGNLGNNIKHLFPDKNIICHTGHCPVHNHVSLEEVKQLKEAHPNAPVYAHPECDPSIMGLVDVQGSTSGIIEEIGKSSSDEFIILTEEGILWELENRFSDKKFYFPEKMVCEGMKKVKIDDIISILKGEKEEIFVLDDVSIKAKRALDNMLAACNN